MNVQQIIQYATLFSVLVGGLGLAVAFMIHRAQVKTQIFLALSARYDELLHSSSSPVWLSIEPGTMLPERSHEVTISALVSSLQGASSAFTDETRLWRNPLDVTEKAKFQS